MAKNLYITTAIPYVNGKPHIGNALDYLIADIWSRYHIQHQKTVRFQVGTDEHGNKIAAKAEAEGLSPQQYTDTNHTSFKALIDKMNVKYTDFIRTTDTHHIAAAQYIWKQLAPYIYKGKYEGWYCIGCEAFVTDKEASDSNGICADHNQNYQRLSEENYYLKTSEFTGKIRQAITDGSMKIVPEFRKNEFLELIKDGLQDVSISRPAKHLSWGIPVPDDSSQVMYVWIDALANYITVLGYPDNEDWKNYWPADIQVIGKDILRFHAGIWPAMLLGIGLPLPKKLLVHGFIASGGRKMSKTVNNVIDPGEIIDTYGVDAFRYYFSRHIPTLDDGDFTWEKFENAYNNELANDLGNLVSRVARMIVQYQEGVIADIPNTDHDTQAYHDAMANCDFDKAMDALWVNVRELNQYIEEVKPWQVAKERSSDPEAKDHLSDILGYCVSSLLQISQLLTPFLPSTAENIKETFASGVVADKPQILFTKQYNHTENPRQKRASNAS